MVSAGRARSVFLPVLLAIAGVGCAQEAPDDEPGNEPVGEATSALTVAQATVGCNSHGVDGLSEQIFEVGNCIVPGAYVTIPPLGNVSYSAGVFQRMEAPAKDAFVACMNAHAGTPMHVNSMLRSVAEQYLLYRYAIEHRCGVTKAATPGSSNHESGRAMDIQNHAGWNGALTSYGFKWFGSTDVVHFDYLGAGSVDYHGVDVRAFQRLWNVNNPGDQIPEDGIWGPGTEARLTQSPAGGFATVPSCGCACSAGQTQTEACVACGARTRPCDGCGWGAWGACVGPAETCDGVDNDCNGLVDDGHPQQLGATPPDFAASLVDMSAPLALATGERAWIWAEFRNVGAKAWPKNGLWLGARGGVNGAVSALAEPGSWPAWNVAAVLDQPVSIGAVGRFAFKVIGPAVAGAEITETFQLQLPGGSFLACPTVDITPTLHIVPSTDAAGGAGGALPESREDQTAGGCSVRSAREGSARGAALGLVLAALVRARRRRRRGE